MIKFALVLIFFLWLLWLQPTIGEDEVVALKLLPFLQKSRFEIDTALFCVATMGLCFASLMAIVDQFGLKRQNKKLEKEARALREEVNSLRNIMTVEQGEE